MEVSDTYPQTHTLVPLSCLFSQAAAEEIRGCQRKRAAAKEKTRNHHRRRKTHTHSSGGVFVNQIRKEYSCSQLCGVTLKRISL